MQTSRIVIAMVGFGEAARAFVAGWKSCRPVIVRAQDIKSADAGQSASMAQAYREAGVEGFANPALALSGASIAVCLVTADQALAAAQAAASYLEPGCIWIDGNSCSPGTKLKAAAVIAECGGHYVDMAIMSPVHPRLHKTPVLLSGEAAEFAAEHLKRLGMEPAVFGPKIGDASSVKMIRSVMIKGLEALTAECFLAARLAGLDEAVLSSLQSSDPQIEWRARGAYNLERMRSHGARRAAEMREVAITLSELGLPARMASATAAWEDQLATITADSNDLTVQLDSVLKSIVR